MGKFLIILGIILIVMGAIIQYASKIPFFGKLPGDIVINRGNFKFYFPIATSILLSIVISILLLIFNRLKQ